MNLTDAVRSIIKPHTEDVLAPLTTIWGEKLDPAHVLEEYPRPQLQRSSYYHLNGKWDYAFTDTPAAPASYQGKILVPFSPESSLSGVKRQLKPGEYLWYRTSLPQEACALPGGYRLLLHFGAVDYEAEITLNGHKAFCHKGGYLPFEVDITDFLIPDRNELVVRVLDHSNRTEQSRGKQSLERGGIFYTAQSGIWQPVWLEQVPSSYLKEVWFETDYDKRLVTAHVTALTTKTLPPFSLTFSYQNKLIASQSLKAELPSPSLGSSQNAGPEPEKDAKQLSDRKEVSFSCSLTLPEEDFHPWSPEAPCLYDAELCFGEDLVRSYFAMRIVTIEKKDLRPVFCLNHEPLFLMGALDQGYWPDGLYTAPSDEALIHDISTMKKLGYNMLRKHIKIETARFYYHCDRLGMIVCQDMVNGGGHYSMPLVSYLPTVSQTACHYINDHNYALLSRKDPKARLQWEKECEETVLYLRFFPSIAIWCPFNEGWGQFDTVRITGKIRSLDPSRLIDSTSGWFDQGCGDFISVHNYFRTLQVPREYVPTDKLQENSCPQGRAAFLSEYGGLACRIDGHSSVERTFGYKHFDTLEEFQNAYHTLIEKSLLPLKAQGLSGAVYTQVSDVEEEVNGLMTYDRRVLKV